MVRVNRRNSVEDDQDPRRNSRRRRNLNISMIEDLTEDVVKTLHVKYGQVSGISII